LELALVLASGWYVGNCAHITWHSSLKLHCLHVLCANYSVANFIFPFGTSDEEKKISQGLFTAPVGAIWHPAMRMLLDGRNKDTQNHLTLP